MVAEVSEVHGGCPRVVQIVDTGAAGSRPAGVYRRFALDPRGHQPVLLSEAALKRERRGNISTTVSG